MRYSCLGELLPSFLLEPLFGDRERYGRLYDPSDSDWLEWLRVRVRFYHESQKRSVGALVNNAGYQVMRRLEFAGKRVLEIGPGDIQHLDYWKGKPENYCLVDIQEEMLIRSASRLEKVDIPHECFLVERDETALPFEDGEFDYVVSFYCLEHFFEIGDSLREFLRVLRPGGKLVGAIPAEGGLARGLGRFLTSRRWLINHSNLNPDKIICWEHPNFAPDVIEALGSRMKCVHLSFWPLTIPSIDLNLVLRFIFEKRTN